MFYRCFSLPERAGLTTLLRQNVIFARREHPVKCHQCHGRCQPCASERSNDNIGNQHLPPLPRKHNTVSCRILSERTPENAVRRLPKSTDSIRKRFANPALSTKLVAIPETMHAHPDARRPASIDRAHTAHRKPPAHYRARN